MNELEGEGGMGKEEGRCCGIVSFEGTRLVSDKAKDEHTWRTFDKIVEVKRAACLTTT